MKTLLSTRTLNLFPEIDEFRKRCIKVSTISRILYGEMLWYGYDYISQDQEREFIREEIESYFSFENDEGFIKILFNQYGCAILGFYSDSCTHFSREAFNDTLLYNLPQKFNSILDIKATIEIQNPLCTSSFAIWRSYSDKEWQIGKIDFSNFEHKDDNDDYEYDYFDGSKIFLAPLNNRLDIINELIDKDYLIKRLNKDINQAIQHIIDFKPINFNFLKNIRSDIIDNDINHILSKIKESGYPVDTIQ